VSTTVHDLRAVILVEGPSDRAAVTTLAARRGRNLDAEGVEVVAMGGATGIYRHLERFGPHGADVRVAGLCDAAETRDVRRGLQRAGFGSRLTDVDLAALGFFVCVDDLEDELIRALGVGDVEAVIEAEGELASLRILQRQPAQQGRAPEQQLHRFIGSKGGRKIRYGALLAAALDLDHVPAPLDAVLDAVLDEV
jgi:hypothetical protein